VLFIGLQSNLSKEATKSIFPFFPTGMEYPSPEPSPNEELELKFLPSIIPELNNSGFGILLLKVFI
jgi:hypothetical protein